MRFEVEYNGRTKDYRVIDNDDGAQVSARLDRKKAHDLADYLNEEQRKDVQGGK